MSKKKGLSMEEKRQRLNSVFFEKCDFLSLKEVEKFGAKEKGLSPMQIKEILQSLVDDDMVKCEKIGTSNYYWSFPSAALDSRKRKLAEVEAEVQSSAAKILTLNSQLSSMLQGREESCERDSLVQAITVKEASVAKLQNEVSRYADCDPEVLKRKCLDAATALDAANRWTDNIFAVLKWCADHSPPGVSQTDLMAQLGIPVDLDYLA